MTSRSDTAAWHRTEDLVLALKGADEPLREKLFSCMSSRAAANLQDEMEAWSSTLTEVREAETHHQCARRLSDEGSIVLAGRGGDDFVWAQVSTGIGYDVDG